MQFDLIEKNIMYTLKIQRREDCQLDKINIRKLSYKENFVYRKHDDI